jgi:hypothetical protein
MEASSEIHSYALRPEGFEACFLPASRGVRRNIAGGILAVASIGDCR